MQKIKFVKLDPIAKMPTKTHKDDTCFDLYSVEKYFLGNHNDIIVDTGIAIQLPKGFEAQIRPRSGMAFKHKIICNFGSIDNSYRGNIKVALFNLSDSGYNINPGDRIAQMKISKVWDFEFEEVGTLDKTERGKSGFGSSGK